MFSKVLDDVNALPAIVSDVSLKELGWTIKLIDDELLLSKGNLVIVMHRHAYGPTKNSSTLGLKKLIFTDGDAYLRYVDNEQPYTKAHPSIEQWGGYDIVHQATDALSIRLHGIALEDG